MNIKVATSGKSFLLKNYLFSRNRVNILDKRSKIMLVMLIYHYMSNFLFPGFRIFITRLIGSKRGGPGGPCGPGGPGCQCGPGGQGCPGGQGGPGGQHT